MENIITETAVETAAPLAQNAMERAADAVAQAVRNNPYVAATVAVAGAGVAAFYAGRAAAPYVTSAFNSCRSKVASWVKPKQTQAGQLPPPAAEAA